MNSKTVILLILFCISIVSNTVLAQKNYVSGKIVTLTNDTIQGFINYHNSSKNPQKIEFVKKGTQAKTIYYPMDIKSFLVENEYYVSRIVSMDASTEDIEEVRHTYSKDPLMKRDTVFLKAYVIGKPSLYYLKDKLGKEHFFIENDSTTELIHNRFVIEGQEDKTIESDKYRQQLLVNMGNCVEVINNIINLKFEESELTKLFVKYNQCKNNKLMYTIKKEKTKVEALAIVGGSLINTFLESPVPSFYYGNMVFKPSYNVCFGVALNLILDRNRKSWSFYNELAYKRNKTTGEINDNFTGYIYNKHFDVDFTYLKLATMFRYQYPSKLIKPFIDAGMVNTYVLNYYDMETITSVSIQPNYSYKREITDGVLKYELGYTFGGGVAFRNYSIEFRYEKTKGFSPYRDMKVPVKSYFILISYKFK